MTTSDTKMTPMEFMAYARKAVVAFVTFAAQALASGIVPQQYIVYVQLAIACAGCYGVYALRNTAPYPSPAESVADERAVDAREGVQEPVSRPVTEQVGVGATADPAGPQGPAEGAYVGEHRSV